MDTLSELLTAFIDRNAKEIDRLRREIDAATIALGHLGERKPPVPAEVAETLSTIKPDDVFVYTGGGRAVRAGGNATTEGVRVAPGVYYQDRTLRLDVSPLTLAALSGSAAFHRDYTDWPKSVAAQYSDVWGNTPCNAGIGSLPTAGPLICPVCRYGPLTLRADDVLVCVKQEQHGSGPYLFDLWEASTYDAVRGASVVFPQHYAAAFR